MDIHTGYDVTNYFQSDATAKITVENATSDGFGSNFSRMVSAAITQFYTFITLTKMPKMTSLAASYWLQNAY